MAGRHRQTRAGEVWQGLGKSSKHPAPHSGSQPLCGVGWVVRVARLVAGGGQLATWMLETPQWPVKRGWPASAKCLLVDLGRDAEQGRPLAETPPHPSPRVKSPG